jgi:hypothetical protein
MLGIQTIVVRQADRNGRWVRTLATEEPDS